LSLGFLSMAFLSAGRGTTPTRYETSIAEEYVPNEVLVRFKQDAGKYLIQSAIDSVQGKVITYLKKEITSSEWDFAVRSQRSFLADPNLLHLKVPGFIGTEKAISILNLNPSVEYAEKNMIIHEFWDPNDQHFSKLWGMKNIGQTGGTVDADIDAPEAWDIFTGSSNIVVAVIDTGVDYNHVDLAANIWINWYEYYGESGVDDDPNGGNGYVDDIRGWNFAYGTNDPMDDRSPSYHGTHVAGTIGALGNNIEGVVGVCWNVKLMAIKILDYSGNGTVSNAINALDYATNNGAYISNNSYGWAYNDPDLVAHKTAYSYAIDRARNKGKLFVAAAGNYQ
jgi:subtilisin family serine protease